LRFAGRLAEILKRLAGLLRKGLGLLKLRRPKRVIKINYERVRGTKGDVVAFRNQQRPEKASGISPQNSRVFERSGNRDGQGPKKVVRVLWGNPTREVIKIYGIDEGRETGRDGQTAGSEAGNSARQDFAGDDETH
jgi:signal peptidase I